MKEELSQIESDLYEKGEIGLTYCGKRVSTLNHSYGPRIIHHYLFVLVNGGEAELYTENKTIRLSEGDLLVMKPGIRVHYAAKTPWSIQWIGLYGKTIDEYMTKFSDLGDYPIIRLSDYEEVERIFSKIYAISSDIGKASRCEQISLIYKLLSTLTNEVGEKVDIDIAYSAKKIIDYNFDKPIKIQDIAASLFVSMEHLSREFMEKYDISPKNYLTNQRIHCAKSLLCKRHISVQEVALSVGYEDALYFSRVFRQKTGHSPSEFRKLNTQPY